MGAALPPGTANKQQQYQHELSNSSLWQNRLDKKLVIAMAVLSCINIRTCLASTAFVIDTL